MTIRKGDRVRCRDVEDVAAARGEKLIYAGVAVGFRESTPIIQFDDGALGPCTCARRA